MGRQRRGGQGEIRHVLACQTPGFLQILARLREYRPDLLMLYYNWDEDGWNVGTYKRTPQDYTDLYNVHTAIESYRRSEAYQKAMTPEDYVKEVREEPKEDYNVRSELYRDTPGFALLEPLNWHYLADNAPYLEAFRTGDQLALTRMYNYEEKGRWNVQDDNYESSEMTTGGRDFAWRSRPWRCSTGIPGSSPRPPIRTYLGICRSVIGVCPSFPFPPRDPGGDPGKAHRPGRTGIAGAAL